MNANKIKQSEYSKLEKWVNANTRDFVKVYNGASLESLSKEQLQTMYAMIDENDLW